MTPTDQEPDPNALPLTAPMAALRSAVAGLDAPRGVEKELMDAFAKQFPPRRWYHALSPCQWGVTGGVAGTAFAAVLALLVNLPAPPRAPLTASLPAAGASADAGADFIALESAERIRDEPNARLVQAEVPRTALASLGVPVTPENASDSVRAELIVGADGAPLALRLVALP